MLVEAALRPLGKTHCVVTALWWYLSFEVGNFDVLLTAKLLQSIDALVGILILAKVLQFAAYLTDHLAVWIVRTHLDVTIHRVQRGNMYAAGRLKVTLDLQTIKLISKRNADRQ